MRRTREISDENGLRQAREQPGVRRQGIMSRARKITGYEEWIVRQAKARDREGLRLWLRVETRGAA